MWYGLTSLIEIPHHFISSQIDGSLVQIHTKFHDYSMLFIQVLFVFHMPLHDMDFTEVQVMEFPWHDRENDPLDFIGFSHFQPNCHQKDKKLRFTFFAGTVWFIFTLSISSFEWNMIRWNHALCFLILRFIVIKAFAQMVHANSMCCGQGIELVW